MRPLLIRPLLFFKCQIFFCFPPSFATKAAPSRRLANAIYGSWTIFCHRCDSRTLTGSRFMSRAFIADDLDSVIRHPRVNLPPQHSSENAVRMVGAKMATRIDNLLITVLCRLPRRRPQLQSNMRSRPGWRTSSPLRSKGNFLSSTLSHNDDCVSLGISLNLMLRKPAYNLVSSDLSPCLWIPQAHHRFLAGHC